MEETKIADSSNYGANCQDFESVLETAAAFFRQTAF